MRILESAATVLVAALATASLSHAQSQFEKRARFAFPATSTNTSSLAVGDFNLDGAPDVVLVDFTSSAQIALHQNDGRGGFVDVTAKALPAQTTTSRAWKVAFLRADRDIFLDILVSFAGQNRLYLNQRNGTFKDVTTSNLPTTGYASYGLAVGDVDADGDMDVVIGNTSTQNELWLNDGNGKFSDVTTSNMPTGSQGAWDATLADVDGDKDLDVFFGNSSAKLQQLYLNDGKGKFTDVTNSQMPNLTSTTRQIVVGDVDGDGDVDAFCANYTQQNRLYLNNGKGTFTDATTTHLPVLTDGSYGAHMIDVDEDGDLDVVVGNFNGNVGLFLNDGKGVFSDASSRIAGSTNNILNIASGDVDRDGDADLVFAGWGQPNGVLFNHEGQLYSDAAPAIGKVWSLDVYAQPGYSKFPQGGAVLLGSGELKPRVNTPFGYLGIAPPWYVMTGWSLTPTSSGKFTVKIAIPNDTRLKNLPLWFQGIHSHIPVDTRLMNVWLDTIQ